jgi:hypothetical protein
MKVGAATHPPPPVVSLDCQNEPEVPSEPFLKRILPRFPPVFSLSKISPPVPVPIGNPTVRFIEPELQFPPDPAGVVRLIAPDVELAAPPPEVRLSAPPTPLFPVDPAEILNAAPTVATLFICLILETIKLPQRNASEPRL